MHPDSKQLLCQRWVMVGVVGKTSNVVGVPTLDQHFQRCWPNVGTSTTHQRWILSCGANVGPKTCLLTIVELSSLTSN